LSEAAGCIEAVLVGDVSGKYYLGYFRDPFGFEVEGKEVTLA
jgi:hypothetical protein